MVDLHAISLISFDLWCMLRGSVSILVKSNLFLFIEDQTLFSQNEFDTQ